MVASFYLFFIFCKKGEVWGCYQILELGRGVFFDDFGEENGN
jgi:hypothetical protein